MMSALTLPQMPDGSQAPYPSELVARAKALGWSQNELARRAKKDSGFVSRLLTGKVKAPGVYVTLVRTVEREERRRAKRERAA
jgi:predicted transcriptional regulator